nr:hypothetical protein [Canary chaphamaparvovirus 2]
MLLNKVRVVRCGCVCVRDTVAFYTGMPGGSNFRQWYAARRAMQERGTWRGNSRPTHSVPAQEDGEPPAQRLRLREGTDPSPDGSPSDPIAGASPETPESLPDLESSPTTEGRHDSQWVYSTCMG